jgi:hypothetical protein
VNEQILERGFATKISELPPLEDLPKIKGATTVADFSYRLHFAPARWF